MLAPPDTSKDLQSLPCLAMLVAYGMQRDIAAHELPLVAEAMRTTEDGKGTAPREADRSLVDYVAQHSVSPGGPLNPQDVATAFQHYRVMDDTDPASLLTDRRLRSTAFDAVAVATAAVDSATPKSAPALPQATGALRRTSRGLAHGARTNSLTGAASFALLALGVALMLLGPPWLAAIGLPLAVGGLLSIALGGSTTARGWSLAGWAVVVVGAIGSAVLAWWVHQQIAGNLTAALALDELSTVTRLVLDNASWAVPTTVGLLGLLVTWMASRLVRVVGHLTTRSATATSRG